MGCRMTASPQRHGMRFLFLTQYFPPETGAPQVRLASLVRELSRAGHGVEIVTAFPNYPKGAIFPPYRGRFYQRASWEGLTVHRTWIYPCMGGGLKRILNYLSFTITCAWGLLRSRRPDFVFVESPPLFLSVPGWIASRVWKSKLIFNVADLWPDSVEQLGILREGLVLRLARVLERWSYRRAAYVNAVTQTMKKILLEQKRVPKERVLFLPNGVDTDLFRPMPPDSGLAQRLGLEGKQVILYAGNHGYIAGLEHALHAAKILEGHRQIHFLFIGGGSEKPRLLELARDLNLPNAMFLDPVPVSDLPAFLSLASICLVTLRNCPLSEGARPAKTFVMMASGKPVVLSARGEGRQMILESGGGVVVAPGDPQAIASALLTLSENPALAREMGSCARRYVEQNFRWCDLIRNWLAQMQAGSVDAPEKLAIDRARSADARQSPSAD
jgi:putative colanic acid biosynthesis glycosyltransferase WcaI